MATLVYPLHSEGSQRNGNNWRHTGGAVGYIMLTLILLGAVMLVIGLILTVKAATATSFDARPIAFFYSLFITSFVFSRLAAALLWTEPNARSAGAQGYEPTVSIVIPAKNEEQAIADSIHQSFAADYPKDKIEVIAINDGSTDNTGAVLDALAREYPGLTVVHWATNRGKRHGMAEGFRLAKGEIVVQLDSDSYIAPKTFRYLIEPFALSTVGAVSAHADPANAGASLVSKMQAAYYFISFRIFKAAESSFSTVLCASGCSSAYRKSIILPILDQWLNERFLGKPVTWGDDRALTSWVLRAGHETVYTFRARAYTIVPETIRQLLKQQVRWKKSWVINTVFTGKFIWKQRPFVALTYFFPLVLVTIATPVVALLTFVYTPLMTGVFPGFYIFGVLLISSLVILVTRLYTGERNSYDLYLLCWSLLNIVLLAYLLFYAVLTIQNRGWGTR